LANSEGKPKPSPGSQSASERRLAETKYDLEERLLEFASVVIDVSEKLPDRRAGNHLAGQLLRSGTSPYGNHGEAQASESAEDFIHKMKICLKELREARRWARLIHRKGWLGNDAQLVFTLGESEELIRIFKASLRTAERNASLNRRPRNNSPPKEPED
jgi:four helix bundle protein